MPIIVPIEDRKVGLATAADTKFRAPDYSGSGLDALGADLAHVGAGGQQLADGIEERRRRAAEAITASLLDGRHRGNIDDAAAKKAYVDYSDGAARILHGEDGLYNRNGADAHAAFPDAVAALADTHDKALAELDDIQRGVVAPTMNERLRSDVSRAAEHVRRQAVIEQRMRSAELQQTAARDAMGHADDPELFDHHVATGENAIRQQGKIDNLPEKVLARQIADFRSGVHTDTIEALSKLDQARADGADSRAGSTMLGAQQPIADAAFGSKTFPPPWYTGNDAAGGSNLGYAATTGGIGTIAPRMINASFDAEGGTSNSARIDPASDEMTTPDAQPASADLLLSAAAGDGGSTPGALSHAARDGGSAATPVVATGDGGAPVPIRIGMPLPLPRVLDAWLRGVAPHDQYIIDTPPDFVTWFRRKLPEFVRKEEHNLLISRSGEVRREHALLVYQSITHPLQFTARTVMATDNQGIKFVDFDTGHRLPFGQFPQLKDYRLVIAEHSHPVPWANPGGTTVRRGPSNMDVVMSKLHPDVYFIIRAVHTDGGFNGYSDETYYIGKGVDRDKIPN